jgi:pyruvate/2-oxoglutarate dehydrogenase complex dihydrolipoamide dehydrogenase (E3) component
LKAGWTVEEMKHDWTTMVQNVNMHIKSLNWGYKMQLKKKEVDYHNEFASFVDPHTLKLTNG